jgi:hypothetical protein
VASFMVRPLYTLGQSPGTHPIGGWVGPTAGLDSVEKMKITFPARNRTPTLGRSPNSLVATLTPSFLCYALIYPFPDVQWNVPLQIAHEMREASSMRDYALAMHLPCDLYCIWTIRWYSTDPTRAVALAFPWYAYQGS